MNVVKGRLILFLVSWGVIYLVYVLRTGNTGLGGNSTSNASTPLLPDADKTASGNLGIAIALLLVALVIYWLWKRNKKKKAWNTSASRGDTKIYTTVTDQGDDGMSREAVEKLQADILRAVTKDGRQKEKGDTVIYTKVTDEDDDGISAEEVERLQTDILLAIAKDDKQKAASAAAELITGDANDAAIDSYKLINWKYPEDSAKWLHMIGVAYYFKQDYGEAIENYIAARDAGGSKEKADDSIWEAVEECFNETGSPEVLETYRNCCPDGSHIAEMERLLSTADDDEENPVHPTISFEEDYDLGDDFETFIVMIFNDAIRSKTGSSEPFAPTAFTQAEDEDSARMQRYFLPDYSDCVKKAEESLTEKHPLYGGVHAEIAVTWKDDQKYDAILVKAYQADDPEGCVFVQRFRQDKQHNVELIGKCRLMHVVESVLYYT